VCSHPFTNFSLYECALDRIIGEENFDATIAQVAHS